MNRRTDYEIFGSSSAKNRRLLRQEELILGVTEVLASEIERSGMTRTEVASRLGKTKGFLSQTLAGDKNLTLRTIADVADALGCRVEIRLERAAKGTVVTGERTTEDLVSKPASSLSMTRTHSPVSRSRASA